MVYSTSYNPTYYSSFQDTVASLCKTLIPFPLRKKRLPAIVAAEHDLAKQQSENLKWQQESFHRILNLIGLQKEGIVPESEVAGFRLSLLETLIKSPQEHEQTGIIRDKLLFLQELFYARCISEDDYHSSKRPLLQRLAVRGVTVDCRDVIIAGGGNGEEEWSAIEFKSANDGSGLKQIKGSPFANDLVKNRGGKRGAANSAEEPLSLLDPNRPSMKMLESFKENPFCDEPIESYRGSNPSILMSECSPITPPKNTETEKGTEKIKKKAFLSLFQKEKSGGVENSKGFGSETEDEASKSAKKQWSFKKWKRSRSDEETAPLSTSEGAVRVLR